MAKALTGIFIILCNKDYTLHKKASIALTERICMVMIKAGHRLCWFLAELLQSFYCSPIFAERCGSACHPVAPPLSCLYQALAGYNLWRNDWFPALFQKRKIKKLYESDPL